MKYALLWIASLALAGSIGTALTQEATKSEPPKSVEAELSLRVPSFDYRKDWAQLGTFSVLADKPGLGAKQIHVVYVERKNLEAYLASGTFPEGTKLIKDVFAAKTDVLPTGTASYAGELESRFVMVKDKSTPSPRFGDGWGWALFKGNETTLTTTANYKNECLACHEAARGDDLLFLRGYPVLRSK